MAWPLDYCSCGSPGTHLAWVRLQWRLLSVLPVVPASGDISHRPTAIPTSARRLEHVHRWSSSLSVVHLQQLALESEGRHPGRRLARGRRGDDSNAEDDQAIAPISVSQILSCRRGSHLNRSDSAGTPNEHLVRGDLQGRLASTAMIGTVVAASASFAMLVYLQQRLLPHLVSYPVLGAVMAWLRAFLSLVRLIRVQSSLSRSAGLPHSSDCA
jgi:hypothetical protein